MGACKWTSRPKNIGLTPPPVRDFPRLWMMTTNGDLRRSPNDGSNWPGRRTRTSGRMTGPEGPGGRNFLRPNSNPGPRAGRMGRCVAPGATSKRNQLGAPSFALFDAATGAVLQALDLPELNGEHFGCCHSRSARRSWQGCWRASTSGLPFTGTRRPTTPPYYGRPADPRPSGQDRPGIGSKVKNPDSPAMIRAAG